MARALLRQEAIFGGSSTGTMLAAALRYCREQGTRQRVVTFVCDGGAKYLSKAYNDAWLYERGFLEREHTGDLRDLIVRRHDAGLTITVQPNDSLLTDQFTDSWTRLMSKKSSEVLAERNVNGFLNLTAAEWKSYAGKVLAIDPRTDEILAVADSEEAAEAELAAAHHACDVVEFFEVPQIGAIDAAKAMSR